MLGHLRVSLVCQFLLKGVHRHLKNNNLPTEADGEKQQTTQDHIILVNAQEGNSNQSTTTTKRMVQWAVYYMIVNTD